MARIKKIIGLIDADLLDNGTRHPNLVLLKLAGFFHDNGIQFELILDPKADTSHYTKIYMSRVFTYTELPELYIYVLKVHLKSENSIVEEQVSMLMKQM